MSKKTLIIVIVLIVAGLGFGLLIGGYIGGTLCQQGKNKPLENAIDPLKCLGSSKIISAVSASGEVTKISGRTVTLSNGIENFPVIINEDTPIYSLISGVKSSFEAIKVGDNLDVNIKVLSNDQLVIFGIIIR